MTASLFKKSAAKLANSQSNGLCNPASDPLWTLSNELEEQSPGIVEKVSAENEDGLDAIFSEKDLKSVSEANRPSMD